MIQRLALTSLLALGLACAGLSPVSPAQAVAPAAASAAPAAATGSTATPAQQRAARTKCVRGSTHSGQSASGTCYKFLSSRVDVVPVEAVPLRNRSSKTATLSCKFTRTIAKSTQYGASVTSQAEVSAVFGLAKLSLSATISKNVTQTETQASEAGGTVVLKPGQKVTCLRTYGSVLMRTEKYSYSGGRITSREIYRVRIPSTLGVDIVD